MTGGTHGSAAKALKWTLNSARNGRKGSSL